MIGRATELEALLAQQRAAARGRGAISIVGGDAGIGKSRLLREMRRKLGTARAHILTGSNSEFTARPFGVFIEALQDKPMAPAAESASPSRDHQFRVFLQRLEGECERRPAVLFLEDLHWADDASLQLLLYIANFIERMRLLIIGTMRTGELHGDHPVIPYLARLARAPHVSRIDLGPLPPDAVIELLRARMPAGAHLAREQTTEIVARSEGNPFFAEELLAAALANGGIARRLPHSIRGAIAERLVQLSRPARDILVRAAVIGREFAADMLCAIADATMDQTLQAIAQARVLQLVDEVANQDSTYCFRHALVREALYEQLLEAQARPLHLRIGRTLERRPDAKTLSVALGYHFWAAHESEPAQAYNEGAGDEAEKLSAHEDALRYYTRALDVASPDESALRGRILGKCAKTLIKRGWDDRSAQYFDDAIAAYLSAAMHDEAGELAWLASHAAQVQGRMQEGVRKIDAVFSAFPSGSNSVIRTRIGLSRAFAYAEDCDAPAAFATLESIRDAALANPATEGAYYVSDIAVLSLAGRLNETRDAIEKYLECAAREGEERLAIAHSNVVVIGVLVGLDDLVKRSYAACVPILLERKLVGWFRYTAPAYAMMLLRNGELRAAYAVTASVFPLGDGLFEQIVPCIPILAIGTTIADEELIERAKPLQHIEACFQTGINVMIGRLGGPAVEYLWYKRRYDEAAALLTRALDLIRHPHGTHELLLAAARFGSTHDRARARSIMEIGLAMPEAIHHHAVSAYFEAIVARREGRTRDAERAGECAHAQFNAMGWKYYSALSLEESGDRTGALALLRECDAVRDVRRIELAMPATVTSTQAATALTAREREIAAQIVEGKSNREIAERLAISQKTVEKHITAMFEKLGLRSRSQLVAHVSRGAGN